jgi:hypothetical protein
MPATSIIQRPSISDYCGSLTGWTLGKVSVATVATVMEMGVFMGFTAFNFNFYQ